MDLTSVYQLNKECYTDFTQNFHINDNTMVQVPTNKIKKKSMKFENTLICLFSVGNRYCVILMVAGLKLTSKIIKMKVISRR